MSTKFVPYLTKCYHEAISKSHSSSKPDKIKKMSIFGLGLGVVIVGIIGASLLSTQQTASVPTLPESDKITGELSVSEISYEETTPIASTPKARPRILSSEIKEVTMYDIQELVMSSEKVSFAVPKAESGAKRWMDYRTITARSSMQWKLQQDAWTDEYGFRRYGDYYMIAMGTYYAEQCGKLFEITLENGFTFLGLISDIKQDRHTDSMNQHKQGNVVEFIVDKYQIPYLAKAMGDMSWAFDSMNSKIASIREIKINS